MHPGIGDTSKLTEEEILEKITELNKRKAMAYSSGRAGEIMINQLDIMLDHYQNILDERIFFEIQEEINKDPKLSRESIDIEWPEDEEKK